VALAIRDGLVGRVNLPMLGLVFAACVGWGAVATRWTTGVLSREDAILGFAPEPLLSRTMGGRRRAAVLALAGTVLAYFYGGSLLQHWQFVAGLALSLWVLLPALGAGSLRLAWSGGRVTEILSLRRPQPIALLGAAALGLGSVVPMAEGLMRLQSVFLPMPEGIWEGMREGFTSVGTVAGLVLIALSPGINEEFVFRGVFLGLFRRVGTTRYAVLISSVGFAIIHQSVYRLMPTFVLGVMMAAVTVRTRSLFPAMVFHAVYNGAAFLGLGLEEAEAGVGHWVGSLALLVIGLLLLRSEASRSGNGEAAA
jgi:membrane protease YdiL (CAAX protease family)